MSEVRRSAYQPHWAITGRDENGDQDGVICRCPIGRTHPTAARAEARTDTTGDDRDE